MTEQKLGFVAQIKSYPAAFWVANTMEIFERMAWYGFYTVSSLYITGPVETGGLGFSSEQRGQLQAIVPFFLYLLPVLTGALADRYGYKRMFVIAYLVMIPSYYALGQFHTFSTFLMAFMFVAVGAAIFKPAVVGTVARLTDESNSATAFGIFYMMVNIGGFFGPIIAGAVRGISWTYVFIACSMWAGVNLVIVLLFYKEPTTETGSEERRTFQRVLDDAVEVLGNLRFFVTVFVVLIALMIANQEFDWFTWTHCLYFVPIWLVLNFVYDAVLPAGSGPPVSLGGAKRNPFLKRMHCSNWRFALFLLIMSGFWTSFNQIFLTMPEYIRDFTDTRPMVRVGRKVFDAIGKPGWIDRLAAIEEKELLQEFDRLMRRANGVESMVPPEGQEPLTGSEIRRKLKTVHKELVKLQEDADLTDEERTEVEELLSSVDNADRNDRDRIEGVIGNAEYRIQTIAREIRRRKLGTDPSLTDTDRDRLAQLVSRLNVSHAPEPLTVLDLVDSARAMLQYKVRIPPTELGELMAAVPITPLRASPQELAIAVRTVNRTLEKRDKEIFEGQSEEQLRGSLQSLLAEHGPLVPRAALVEAAKRLSSVQNDLKPADLASGVRDLAYRPVIWERIDAGRQVNPEHIVNFDALAIVLLQILVSFLMAKFHRFTTMIVGMVVAAVGIGLSAAAGGTMIGPLGGLLLVVIVGMVIFAIGEMMASPTSQEYVARIAPHDKKALYMGYYFVSVALGNLFGGILSGQLYGKLARDMQRPDLMWMIFGGLMLFTAIVFLIYNRFALRQEPVVA